MSLEELAAALFFSAVIVVVLGVIVYTEQMNATQMASVWVVTHNVVAGTPFSANNVQLVQVRSGSGDFNFEVDGPSTFHALFVRSLTTNDILRSDDLIAASAESQVAITVEDAPPLAPGDDHRRLRGCLDWSTGTGRSRPGGEHGIGRFHHCSWCQSPTNQRGSPSAHRMSRCMLP